MRKSNERSSGCVWCGEHPVTILAESWPCVESSSACKLHHRIPAAYEASQHQVGDTRTGSCSVHRYGFGRGNRDRLVHAAFIPPEGCTGGCLLLVVIMALYIAEKDTYNPEKGCARVHSPTAAKNRYLPCSVQACLTMYTHQSQPRIPCLCTLSGTRHMIQKSNTRLCFFGASVRAEDHTQHTPPLFLTGKLHRLVWCWGSRFGV